MKYQFKNALLALVAVYSTNAYSSSLATNPSNPLVALLKMVLALVFVLAVLWGFAQLLKRFHAPLHQSRSGLKLISTYNLGQREKLVVMQVGDEQLLLGVSPAAISKLHVLPAPLNLDSIDESGSFKKTLNAAINREIPQ